MIIGDYPYYRDAIEYWEKKIIQIKKLGINVVTFYIPWRHHLLEDGSFNFGFDQNIPNRNVNKFIKLLAKHKLYAIARPGPFIHAEVELGGLPDNVSPSYANNIHGIKKRDPQHFFTSEGKKLPFPFDEIFLQRSQDWYTEVCRQVIFPNIYPKGQIIAVQIGNEGIFSDTNWPEEIIDFISLCESHINEKNLFNYIFYQKYIKSFVDIIKTHAKQASLIFSIAAPSFKNGLTQWFQRVVPETWYGIDNYAYTSWQGNAVYDMQAFMSLLIAAKRYPGLNIEENAGFPWHDQTYRKAHTLIFHAALHLAAGAKCFAIYPAVTTTAWRNTIAANPTYLQENPECKKYYDSPYGECAPVNATGGKGETYEYIKSFIDFIKKYYIFENNDSIARAIIIWPHQILTTNEITIKDQFNVELSQKVASLCSLGMDFDLVSDLDINEKKLIQYKYVFPLTGCNLQNVGINSIYQRQNSKGISKNGPKENYFGLTGGAYMFFTRENKSSDQMCGFLFNLDNHAITLSGDSGIGKLYCVLPAKAVLIFIFNKKINKIVTAYFKAKEDDPVLVLSLILSDQNYFIKNNEINNFFVCKDQPQCDERIYK